MYYIYVYTCIYIYILYLPQTYPRFEVVVLQCTALLQPTTFCGVFIQFEQTKLVGCIAKEINHMIHLQTTSHDHLDNNIQHHMTSHDEIAIKQGSGTDACSPRHVIPVLPGSIQWCLKLTAKTRTNSANNHGNTMSLFQLFNTKLPTPLVKSLISVLFQNHKWTSLASTLQLVTRTQVDQ